MAAQPPQPYQPTARAAFLRLVDSITELSPGDEGCVAVSGSHGGLSSARYVLAARPHLSVFNDAGGGMDKAGFAGLAFLQGHGLAACTVGHHSARIGEAASTMATGVISQVNLEAAALGIAVGWPISQALDFLIPFQKAVHEPQF
jgi:hypothetical protein